ncbi:MJ0042 family finger-like domain-containing protein [Desulfonatronum thiosulfatophilum]|uniref:MJ0042 family finger-like domain-containing protein n=1 Tax=Desulfonatronum thiosulfatophilum TaxID=617002 RepID=A0A1G6BK29_9BACT|nr:zinc-ribbon domain-containing protein [Desulfonatronum thiosulfatophilum]SDB20964.1 MJ0042 family finger-like domain-containing protein [Desulfonatronum thiosulfatophilum]
MRLICPHCAKQLSVADEKIPVGQRFRLNCPQCSQSFAVDPNAPQITDATADSLPSSPPEKLEDNTFYPPGAKIAFLCLQHPAWQRALIDVLGERGHYLVSVSDAVEALRKLETAPYELIFVEQSPHNLRVLQRIHGWPGLRRRGVNVVLLGTEAPSLHPDASLRNGVNWYLHLEDHSDAAHLVQTIITGYEETYKTWRLVSKNIENSHS